MHLRPLFGCLQGAIFPQTPSVGTSEPKVPQRCNHIGIDARQAHRACEHAADDGERRSLGQAGDDALRPARRPTAALRMMMRLQLSAVDLPDCSASATFIWLSRRCP